MSGSAASEQPGPRPGSGQRILLVSTVGFASGWVPLGIALIKSYLSHHTRFQVETLSLSVQFSEHVERTRPALASYDQQMGEWGSSFHELYYAASYLGHAPREQLLREAIRHYLEGTDIYRVAPWESRPAASEAMIEFHFARVEEFCRLVDDFSRERFLAAMRREQHFLVGFSVTAQQIFSSAMLARLCREHFPGTAIVLGGPAITARTAQRFLELVPEADYVVHGDGEEPMRRIAALLASGTGRADIPGVLQRGHVPAHPVAPASAPALDDVPTPNYDELRDLVAQRDLPLGVWMGRGCSWGRCTFCSIPSFQRRTFNRSPQRIYADLVALSERYGARRFRFGDWEVNGDPRCLTELCRLLIQGEHRFEIWAEVNARNLTSELVALMKQAGFMGVQVGLESFSPGLLRKMKKPATLLDNVRCLLFAHEHDISLFSNILYGFPGETDEEIAESLANIRRLRHLLRPPVLLELIPFLLEVDADVYAEHASHTRDALYRFESACTPPPWHEDGPYFLRRWDPPLSPMWRAIKEEVSQCREGPGDFTHRIEGDQIHLRDTRTGTLRQSVLSGHEARLYRALVGDRLSRNKLSQALPEIPAALMEDCLAHFEEQAWVLRDRQHTLALSLGERRVEVAAAHEAQPSR